MSEVQAQDVELDTDGIEETSIDVEQPSTVAEATATPEVDLGYTDPVNNDKAKLSKSRKVQIIYKTCQKKRKKELIS